MRIGLSPACCRNIRNSGICTNCMRKVLCEAVKRIEEMPSFRAKRRRLFPVLAFIGFASVMFLGFQLFSMEVLHLQSSSEDRVKNYDAFKIKNQPKLEKSTEKTIPLPPKDMEDGPHHIPLQHDDDCEDDKCKNADDMDNHVHPDLDQTGKLINHPKEIHRDSAAVAHDPEHVFRNAHPNDGLKQNADLEMERLEKGNAHPNGSSQKEYNQLMSENQNLKHVPLGIPIKMLESYKPDAEGKFVCLKSKVNSY